MPIKVPDGLPAIQQLNRENIFVIQESRAVCQDIRPLKVLILNLMPTKIETETQLLRLLGNTPLQIEAEFLQAWTHQSKNTSEEHLLKFYRAFEEIEDNCYDGMVVTGAPVEQMPFEQVDYWPEFCRILDWSAGHVWSSLHICWGAQAALYRYYGIQKYALPKKLSGVYSHRLLIENDPLVRGFDEEFFAPHSRYTGVRIEDLEQVPDLKLLAVSKDAGVYLAASQNGRRIFVTGHSEYDKDTLDNEYRRDIAKALAIEPPVNYYKQGDPSQNPVMRWKGHAHLLFSNWLNYVYQETPFDLQKIAE